MAIPQSSPEQAVSLDITNPSPTPRRRGGDGADGAPLESRSWDTREPNTQIEARNNPSMSVRLGRGKRMTVVVDRVRAKPAIEPTLSFALGQNAMGLGVWGTFFPNSVNRFLGMNAHPEVVRTIFGLREFATAFALTGDPTNKTALWSRVAGDMFDIAVLSSLSRADNPKRNNARVALGVVLAVTAADAFAAWRMTTVKRNCA